NHHSKEWSETDRPCSAEQNGKQPWGGRLLEIARRHYCGRAKARRLQRPEGQHDDLACIRRARSCQGSHRRTAASRHGGRTPLRSACRMVTAAPMFRKAAQQSSELRNLIVKYNEVLLA